MPAFLLEVGTEELPASFVAAAIAQWQNWLPTRLAEAQLTTTQISVYGTPRRLAVLIEGLPDRQPDREEEVKGPPASAAFKDGEPTPAAIGFARKQGVEVSDFTVRETDKGAFVFVQKREVGQPLADVLQSLVPSWIQDLEGKRFMRWGDGDLRFSRPIRWLVALIDDQVLPLELTSGGSTVQSDRLSRGHRVLHPEPVAIAKASDYLATLEAASVLVDPAQRQAKIEAQTAAIASKVGGQAELPEDLLAEVVHLTEWPTAVLGQFEERFLSLPAEVSTMVMTSHQRYFPIYQATAQRDPAAIDARSELLPCFVTISNGDPAASETIAAGNARVIRARLADGEYFYRTDSKQPLESFLSQLEAVTFQEQLGSVRSKVDRIGAIAHRLCDQLSIHSSDRLLVSRAAQLCKADLVSQMVYEFPELQGVMGEKYARVSQEPDAVATAIREHYLPKGAGDQLPQTLTGRMVALADRLDTLVCIFGLGLLPSGSSDPFALRRAANGVLNILWDGQLRLDLTALIQGIAADFHHAFPKLAGNAETLIQQLTDFFGQRLRTLLQDEQGIDYDLVNAVLGDGDANYLLRAIADPLDALNRAKLLQTLRQDGRLVALYETVNRATRLASKGDLDTATLDPTGLVNADLFQQPSEAAFLSALTTLQPLATAAQASQAYEPLVEGLLTAAPAVQSFFDGDTSVLVMDPDPAIQQNRLNLLGLLRNQARVLADFGAIVKGE